VRRGYELNYKLLAVPSQKHEGILPSDHSFVQVESENVVLTAMKKSEDDDSLILRFYEWAGKEADVKLQLPRGAQSVSETDLMERPIADLAVHGNAVTVHTKPYEIKTVKVQFARHTLTESLR
jgi:alpha-mannosidase